MFDPESTILSFVNTALCLVRAYLDVLAKTGPKWALYLPLGIVLALSLVILRDNLSWVTLVCEQQCDGSWFDRVAGGFRLL